LLPPGCRRQPDRNVHVGAAREQPSSASRPSLRSASSWANSLKTATDLAGAEQLEQRLRFRTPLLATRDSAGHWRACGAHPRCAAWTHGWRAASDLPWLGPPEIATGAGDWAGAAFPTVLHLQRVEITAELFQRPDLRWCDTGSVMLVSWAAGRW